MKKMMSYVERSERELGVWESDPDNWTADKVTKLYETVHWKFKYHSQRGTRRFEGLMWKTYLNMVRKAGGILIGDEKLPPSNQRHHLVG